MILCDIDGVLATGPSGDTEPGGPIYRTSLDLPAQLQRIVAAGIPFHVVTAKVESEALQVLRAVGAEEFVGSLISADKLFWPSVWSAIRSGRLPGSMSKRVCERLLPQDRSTRTVMIENHAPHLHEMLAFGVVDFGILVPPMMINDGRVDRWFDLEQALRLATILVTEGVPSSGSAMRDVAVFRWGDNGPARLESGDLPPRIAHGSYLLHIPGLAAAQGLAAPRLESLDTGRSLQPGRPNVVTTVRSGRRFLRRLMRSLFARSA